MNRNYDGFGQAYNYFNSTFGWDSFDGVGAAIKSYIHWGTTPHAKWDKLNERFHFAGTEYTEADDLIGHEVLHSLLLRSAEPTPAAIPSPSPHRERTFFMKPGGVANRLLRVRPRAGILYSMFSGAVLHKRSIPDIVSEPIDHWQGRPLTGTYFIRSTLAEGAPRVSSPMHPIILTPGGFDPHAGDYSEALIKRLLIDVGAPEVLELHYRFDDKPGYIQPDAVEADLVQLLTDGDSQPVLIALCGGCLSMLEGLLAAAEVSAAPPGLGVMLFGSYLPNCATRIGRTALNLVLRQVHKPSAKVTAYAGHPYLPEGVLRLLAWYESTRLKHRFESTGFFDPPDTSFPFPVEFVYFQYDFLARWGRRRLRNIFNSPRIRTRVRKLHRDLRKAPDADEMILSFYRRMVQRAPASRAVSDVIDRSASVAVTVDP